MSVLAAAIAVATVLCTGCGGHGTHASGNSDAASSDNPMFAGVHETTYTGLSSGTRVGILGDSITYLSRSQIHQVLDPSYAVQIDANISEQLDGTVGTYGFSFQSGDIDRIRASSPSVVVVNLGTNQGDSDLVIEYRSLVQLLRPACVIGVTVNDHNDPRKFPNDHAKSQALNASLPTIVDVVADWNAIEDPYTSGGVHPNNEGSLALARLYAEAIPRCHR